MLDEKDIQAIAQIMSAQLAPVNARLDKVDSRLDKVESRMDRMERDISQIRETQEMHTECLNALIEWADACRAADRFPLPRL